MNAKNNAKTTLRESISDSDTIIRVDDINSLPNPPFMLTIESEIVKVLDIDDDQLVVERGAERTITSPYSAGTTASNIFTAGMYNNLASVSDIDKVKNVVSGGNISKGRLVTDFSEFYPWFGSVSHTADNSMIGDKSLRIATDPENPSSLARQSNTSLYLDSVRNLILRVYVENSNLLSRVRIIMHASADKRASIDIHRADSLIDGWNEIPITIEDFQLVEMSIDEEITYMDFGVVGNNTTDKHATVYFDGLYMNALSKPNIIMHFDDGFISQYTNAFKIMKSRGLVGCIGVYTDAVGWSGYMNEDQLKDLYVHGWELFNHTVTHRDLTELTKEEIEQEVYNCKKWLDQRGYIESSDIIAYPYGSYNEDVIDVSKDFRLGRTTSHGLEVSDINHLRKKAFNIFDDTEVSTVTGMIDKLIFTSGTLILLFHKIDNSGENISWSLEKFKDLIDYLDNKRDSVDVITTNEWLNKI